MRADQIASEPQVTKFRTILAQVGLEAASPDEGRQILKLKGRHNVRFE